MHSTWHWMLLHGMQSPHVDSTLATIEPTAIKVRREVLWCHVLDHLLCFVGRSIHRLSGHLFALELLVLARDIRERFRLLLECILDLALLRHKLLDAILRV
jgi:hypothetical protein